MKTHKIKGYICVKDNLNIEYILATIEQIYFEDDSFKYIFKPFYNIIELCDSSFFQGIPGLNLDLKKEEYIRENKTPTFIYERTPQENREDVWKYLKESNMEYLDKLEWLIKNNKVYTGDRLYVKEYSLGTNKTSFDNLNYKDVIKLNSIDELSKDNYLKLKRIMMIITSGSSLITNELVINDSNRKDNYILFKNLYSQEHLKRQEKTIKKRGRKKIQISTPLLIEVVNKLENNTISINEALKITGLTKSTFYRKLNNFKKSDTYKSLK